MRSSMKGKGKKRKKKKKSQIMCRNRSSNRPLIVHHAETGLEPEIPRFAAISNTRRFRAQPLIARKTTHQVNTKQVIATTTFRIIIRSSVKNNLTSAQSNSPITSLLTFTMPHSTKDNRFGTRNKDQSTARQEERSKHLARWSRRQHASLARRWSQPHKRIRHPPTYAKRHHQVTPQPIELKRNTI